MNIAIPIQQFTINNVFFQEPIKNTIMNDSSFIRIVYSDELCMLNGICIAFTLPIIHIDKSFNKYRCTFDNQLSSIIIETINKIELSIINKLNIKNKQPSFRIADQLKNGLIKVSNMTNNMANISNTNNHKTFIIKISGVWSTSTEYGMTYKFTQS